MTKELSNKIRLVSLLCTIMVLYRHAHTAEAFHAVAGTGWQTYNIIAHGITYLTSIAVPYFFLISGFFFFKCSYYTSGNYKKMILKKIRTLLLPFLIWNILAIFPLWYSGKMVIENHWYMYIVDLLHSDYNGPLWYVRTLMLLMLLSPLYDWMFQLDKRIGKKAALAVQMLVVACIFYIWWPMDSKVLSTEGWLFFLLGGILRNNEKWIEPTMNKKLSWVLYICWCASCFIVVSHYWTDKIHLFLGVVLFWNVVRHGGKGWVAAMAGYSFFIYVNHFILLKVIKTLLAHFFYGNELAATLTFLLSPVFVLVLTWKIGEAWHRYSPVTFAWVTGGRA